MRRHTYTRAEYNSSRTFALVLVATALDSCSRVMQRVEITRDTLEGGEERGAFISHASVLDGGEEAAFCISLGSTDDEVFK